MNEQKVQRIEWRRPTMANSAAMREAISTFKGPTPQNRMFILLALLQYSGWIGNVDSHMTYPRDFEVDYVRVYARENEYAQY